MKSLDFHQSERQLIISDKFFMYKKLLLYR